MGSGVGVDQFGGTCSTTSDLGDVPLRLGLPDLNRRSDLLGLLLILFGLGLLHSDLRLDERLLSSGRELHVYYLKVHTVGVERLQSGINIEAELLGVALSILPESSRVEITNDLTNTVIDLRDEGLLIVLLVVSVQLANVFLLEDVLQREGEAQLLTVTVLDEDGLGLRSIVVGEVDVLLRGGEGDEGVDGPDKVPTTRINIICINSLCYCIVNDPVLDRLHSTDREQEDDEDDEEPANTAHDSTNQPFVRHCCF